MCISIQKGSHFEVDKLVDSFNLCDKVSITVAWLDVEGNLEKSLRRFNLSLLKSRSKVSEIFVLDGAKDE